MTLSIERARSRKPITWLTLLGILLLPAAVGGILVAALQNPTERLETMSAAIVNLDEPVTIDGQQAPIGRQLASGLVDGSDEFDSNLNWVISNEDDAASGLADGSYQAVITIPEDFSAASTSAGQAIADGSGKAEQAMITVTTAPDGLVADDLITGQIATVAASTLGTMLSEATLENVLVGFTTIGDQIGEAASGASELATGARSAATGAAKLPDGATQLADGATQLGSGVAQLGNGASQLATGATQLSEGASQLAGGLDTIAGKTLEAGAGAAQLGTGLTAGADQVEANGLEIMDLKKGAQEVATGTSGLAEQCASVSSDAEFCAQLTEISGVASGVSGGLDQLPSDPLAAIAAQMREAGAAVSGLGGGLGQLASGVDQSAGAARQLGSGASELSTGASGISTGAEQLSTGANELGTGASDLATGATGLVTGLDKLADGTGELASGLDKASSSLPSFNDEESTSLASVVADPVTTNSSMNTIFGPTAIPLLAAVVLWFGGLASFIAMRAYTERALTSRRSSASLTLRAFAPAALLGAGQGLLLAFIVQFVAQYEVGTWWAFAGTAVLAGVAFAAVNQALVALFGGIGRWVSALVGVLAVATGLISTVPGWLASLGEILPTAPAFAGLIAGNGSAVAALVVWGVLALGATTLAVTLRRTTSAKAVLAGT